MRTSRFAIAALALLVACKDQSPRGLDPIVKITNEQPGVFPRAVMAWYSQSGLARVDTIPPGATECVEFTSATPTDSVRFVVVVGDTAGGGSWAKQESPWFDPTTGIPTAAPGSYPFGAEYWTVDVTDSGASMLAVQSPPCAP
jgi:hypothetical protein